MPRPAAARRIRPEPGGRGLEAPAGPAAAADHLQRLVRPPATRDPNASSRGWLHAASQNAQIEEDLIGIDEAVAELNRADAVRLDSASARRNRGVPEVEKAVVHGNRAPMGPDPGWVSGEEDTEIGDQLVFAPNPEGNRRIGIERIVGIEGGEALRVVPGPSGEPAICECLGLCGGEAREVHGAPGRISGGLTLSISGGV